jgi:1-acyl-sn-glycerol-3-phosphate acyltransferase
MATVTISVLIAGAILVFLWRRLLRVCDAANGADWGKRWLNRLDGLIRIFCRRFHRLELNPLRLPPIGGVLLASNHISGLDPLLLIASCSRPLRFLIAREQYDRFWLRWLFRAVGCIPVERTRNPRAALYAAREALTRGEVVALFPQGRIHLDHHPPTPIKRGIVLLSRMTQTPIVPVRVTGVRGQGLTVAAVLLRSHARVQQFEAMNCQEQSVDECLEGLWKILTGQSGRGEDNRVLPSVI